MTLSAFAWNIVRTYTLTPGRRYSFGCRYRLGTASNLVMYVSAADNDYVGVTGTFLGTASQGVWSTARLDFSVPPGGIAKLFGGSIPGLVQQSAGTLDLYSMQIRASAFEGESVSVTDLLADSLALTGSATLDGLTAQGNVGCDQLLCNDVNCTDVSTGVDASGAVSCAALTATGTVAGATLSSAGAVSGSSLSISGAASVGLLSSATGITGSTLTINNTANAGNFTTVGDVSTGTLTASGAATAASFAATGALTGATLTITGAASAGPLDCESLDCTFTATSGGVSTGRGLRRCDELGHGLRAAALRLQHAHRDQHLRLLGRSLPDEELGGLEQAADFQQQRGLRQRSGAAAAGQSERQGLPGAGRRDAPVELHD